MLVWARKEQSSCPGEFSRQGTEREFIMVLVLLIVHLCTSRYIILERQKKDKTGTDSLVELFSLFGFCEKLPRYTTSYVLYILCEFISNTISVVAHYRD